MPPINKRPKTSIPGLPTGPAPGVQDYRDPFKKTILNPEPLNPMELVLKQQRERTVAKAAQAGATGKQRKAGAKAVRVLQQTQKAPTAKALERMRIVEEGEAALRYNLNDPLLENSEKLKEVRSEMDRQYYQDQVENGPLLAETSPLVRGFDRAVVATTKTTGQLFQDVFGSDEGSTVLGDVGKYIASLGEQAEGELAQFHQYEKPKEQKSIYERSMEFLGSAPVSLAQFAAANAVAGPVLGFGALRVEEARSRGERNPVELTKEFAFGAATGALLQGLGKTADVVGRYSKVPGISTLAKAPRLTQAGAQFIGGAAQTYGETFLAKDTDIPPDGFDYLAGGLFNVALDPVVFGPSPKAKKATAIAVESTAKWANDQIPPSGLAELRDDFWQPMDVPWSEKVTADLLKRARAQFVEAPGEPEGTLFVNPQAAMILQRLGESLDNPSARVAASTSQGTSLTTEAAQLLSARARAKANEVKQVVAQLPNGHEKLIPYAESAVMYESLADTLDAATAGNRPLNMRFIRQSDMTDPTNPTAVKWSDKVIGHESWHAQDHKTAASVKSSWNMLAEPFWLMEHPLGAKLFSTMGDEGNPLGQTGMEYITGEALAYAAQPGESPIGLTTQERGILVGDYLAHLQDKYGGGILAQRYAGRIDREVAKVAFRRLYEAGRVKFARNGEGKAIGLEWPDIVPPMNQEIPNDPYRGVYQAPLNVEKELTLSFPIWFSSLERFVESKVKGSMPAQQLAAMIRNGNLRPGELEWTGVLDWLQEQGGRKVTRDEVLSELERRRVDVQEVWKGRGPKDFDELQEVNKAIDDWYAEFYPDNRLVRTLTPEEDARLSALNQRREAIEQRISSSRPRYQNYIQPGESSNYRELLLTLPARPDTSGVEVVPFRDGYTLIEHGEVPSPNEDRIIFETREEAWEFHRDESPSQDNYRSGHWDEPNILAHIRMTDRRAADGGKVLFIEEVQSDWHQAGAKHGYKSDLAKLQQEYDQLRQQLTSGKIEPFSPEHQAALDRLRRLKIELDREDYKVSDAPFKKTWPELAMRRMIRYAAENGYDQVAWVRGEEADASVGGKSSWFYDRNLVNTANNILKKWGVRVTLPVPPKIKPKQTKFLPADALGWARNSDGLISIYPIKDKAVDYNRQSENIPLDDLARVLDEQSVADIRAAIDNQVNDFGSMAGFETATHSGKIQRDGIQVADTEYHVLAMADFKKLNTLRNKYSFPITPEMKLSVLKEGQAIPLNNHPLNGS
jgi:hypothetical protein